MSKDVPKTSAYIWTAEKSQAALLLAEGYTYQQVGDEIEKSSKTIQRWMADMEFSCEVDRLSLMVGIASKAERLRLAKRVIRQKLEANGTPISDKDFLDWLKFAQSETDGVKLDIASLFAAIGQDDAPMADSGSGGDGTAETA